MSTNAINKIELIVYREDSLRRPYFLLLKRTKSDGGFWQFITGTVEPTETLQATIYREAQEETGITALHDLSDRVHTFTWGHNKEAVYAARVLSELVTLSTEHDEFQWCNYKEALILLKYEENKKALELFYKTLVEGT
jgi:dihydroneopterin triphosphate diphosphatase